MVNLMENLENKEILKTLQTNPNQQTQTPPTPEIEPDVVDKSTVDPNLTVENQMAGLLNTDSPYLTAARTRGLQAANARGLLNTSMSAGASEKSAIESALPIAQQDAKYLQESASKTQTGRVQGGLYEKQGEISKDIATHEGDIASGLSTQEATQAQDLEQMVQAGANYRQQLTVDANNALKTMDLGTKERTAYANSASELGEKFMLELTNIQRDPNVRDKTAAITTLQQSYHQNMQTLASIYNVHISWEPLSGYPLYPDKTKSSTNSTDTSSQSGPRFVNPDQNPPIGVWR